MSTRLKTLEKKYKITIEPDMIYNPLTGRTKMCYRIYTADGCSWENGLSYNALIAECKKYENAFRNIYETAKEYGMLD